MSVPTPHALQPFWNIAAAPIQAQAVDQAIEHRLFALLHKPKTADDLARTLGLNPVGTAIWLDLLWGLDLLVRSVPPAQPSEAQYTTSPVASRFFMEGSAENCAQAWMYRARFLARFAGTWGKLLHHESDPQTEAAPKGSWAQAARGQIGQEQRAVTVPAVLNLLDRLPALPATGRLLDLGGGPGHVGIALAQRLPGWQAVLCDQPETAQVAQENIEQAGLSARAQALGCDLDVDAIGHGYDLIWCSSVLHFLNDPQRAVRKMFDALNPGGLLLLAHAECTNDKSLSARVMPFYSSLVVRGHLLPRTGELARMMAHAGFAEICALGHIDFPMAPVWVHRGRKA